MANDEQLEKLAARIPNRFIGKNHAKMDDCWEGRVCGSCGQWKTREELISQKGCKYGKRKLCISCNSRSCKSRYAENREERREAGKKYYEENKEKVLEINRRWYWKNRDRAAETHRRWRENNRERANEICRKWRLGNLERRREIVRDWDRRNPENRRYRWRKRRALKKEARHDGHTAGQLAEYMLSFDVGCVYCGGEFEEIDHDIPLSRGGHHTLENLVPCCGNCNRRKGSKTGEEFMSWLKGVVDGSENATTEAGYPSSR